MAKEKEQGEPPRERESIEGRNLSWMQIHRPPLVISDSIINVAAGWMDWLFAQHQQLMSVCTLSIELETKNQDESRA